MSESEAHRTIPFTRRIVIVICVLFFIQIHIYPRAIASRLTPPHNLSYIHGIEMESLTGSWKSHVPANMHPDSSLLHSQINQRRIPNYYSSSQADSNFVFVGEWAWGACFCGDLKGNIALISSGRSVLALDISNLISPVLLGEYKTYSLVSDIKIRDSIAYVLTGKDLLFLDVSDPTHMRNLNEVQVTNTGTYRIVLEYPLAYISTLGQLLVVDVGNALDPSLVGVTGIVEESSDIAVRNGTIYIGSYLYGGFEIIDASDPAHPRYSNFIVTGGENPTVGVRDTLLFAPQAIRSLTGDSSYILTLQIYSITHSDTAMLLLIDTVGYERDQYYPNAVIYATAVTITGNLVYIATGDSGVYEVDISNLLKPLNKGKVSRNGNIGIGISQNTNLASTADRLIYAAASGLWILGIDRSGNLIPGSFFITGGVSGPSINKDGYLIVGENFGGVAILNVSDPANPVRVSALEFPRRNLSDIELTGHMVCYGHYLYVSTPSGIEIGDLIDIKHPCWVGHINEVIDFDIGKFNIANLAVQGCLLYTAHDSIFSIYTLCNPVIPKIISEETFSPDIRDFVLVGTYVYIASNEYGTTIVDLSNPTLPRMMGVIHDTTLTVAVKDTILYAANRYGLKVFSISRPDHIYLLTSIGCLAEQRGGPLLISGDILYVLFDGIVLAFDVSVPSGPISIASLTYDWDGISASSEYAYLSQRLSEGVGIFKNLRAIVSNGPSSSPHFTLNLFPNYPNPFNLSTTIFYDISTNQTILTNIRVRLTIYDMLGRLVSNLVDEDQNPGQYKVQWSPTNLSSGTYFARLDCFGNSVTRRMVLMK